MKKLIAIILIFILILSFCGCNTTDQTQNASNLINDAFIDPCADWQVYDNLINEIKNEKEPAKRLELMRKAEDILMACGCIIPIYYHNDVYMQKPYLKNVYSNNLGFKYFYNCELSNGETILKANIGGEPSCLDPAFFATMISGTLLVNAFAGLYKIDNDGTPIPDLATSYTHIINNDGSVTYTIKLLEDLKWSDGSKLSAVDFEYSWKRAAKTETGAYNSSLFSIFKGYPDNLLVSARNDNTLEFTLNAPCPYIETLLSHPTLFPVHKNSVENFNTLTAWCEDANFICNGPFILANWSHNKTISFIKNPYYHNISKVNIEAIEFILSENASTLYSQYKSNKIDFLDTISLDSYTTLRSHADFKTIDIIRTNFLSINAESDIFKGKTPEESACIRLALNTLIDRAYIIQSVGKSGQTVATSIVPLGTKDGNGGIFREKYKNAYYDGYLINNSPEEAIKLARNYLNAAGYKFGDNGKLSPQTPIVLKYLTDDNEDNVNIAESIKADFKELGIELIINQVDWNTFITNRNKGTYDIVRSGFNAPLDDPIYILEEFTTDSTTNYCRFGK